VRFRRAVFVALVCLVGLGSGAARAAGPGIPRLVPNDPGFGSFPDSLEQIDAPSAWKATTGSPDVVIAVVDTGVNPTPDLAPNLVPGWNVVANNADTSDHNGHGSAVASIAAGRIDDAAGVAGVCGSCRVMPVKVTSSDADAGLSTTALVAQGITWAAAHGAQVINVAEAEALDGGPVPEVADAIASAAAAGAVVVLSAGNDGSGVPAANRMAADSTDAIRVAGSTWTGDLDPRSNYGSSWVDISASFVGAANAPLGGFGLFAGTSVAVPLVAGTVGLMLSYHPALTPAEIKSILLSSGTKVAGLDVACTCIVNAFNALEALGYRPPAPISLLITAAGKGSGQIHSTSGCVAALACTIAAGDQVRLSAAPDRRSLFAGWRGAPGCGRAEACTSARTDLRITATFTLRTQR
jgi:subtilisin family serine protease